MDALQQNLLNDRLSELLGVPATEVFDLLARAKRAMRRSARQDSHEVSDASAYEMSLAGVPPTVVSVMETLFGHLVTNPDCWDLVDDSIERAAGHSKTWQTLYRLLLDVRSDVGQYSIQDLLARCDDGALCELVSRARARVEGLAAPEDFGAALNRLASELRVQRWGQLREGFRTHGGCDDQAFEALRDAARGEDSFLPRDSRCNLSPSG
jgi:hypothetical protein